MKTTRKAIALLLAGLLAGLSLAGCGGAPAEPGSSAPAPGGEESAPQGDGKHVITVMGKDRRYDVAPFSDRDSYPVWQEVEKLLAANGVTCEFELIPKEQYATVLQTRLAAASDLPDVISLDVAEVSEQNAVDLGNQGTIIDIKTAIEQYSNGNTMEMWGKYWPDATKQLTTPEGKIYWYPSLSFRKLNGEATKGTGFAMQYRGDWLKKVGLAEPTTTEELLTVLKAFREKDANGNGQADEIAAIKLDAFDNGIAQAYGLAPNLFDIENKTGKAVTPWLQPGIKDYILFMQRMVQEGVLDPSMIGSADAAISQSVTENRASLIRNYEQQNWFEPMTGDDNADYVPINPTGKEGIEPVFHREPSTLVYQKFAITKNCKDVEGAVRLFDTLYTEEYALLSMWGIEGLTYEMEDGRKVQLHPEWGDEERAEAKALVGHSLCGNTVFPVVNIQEEWNDILGLQGVSEAKQAYEVAMQSYDNDYFTSMTIAMPTEEESSMFDRYYTTLETYSSELLVNLILGNKSIDELDAAIEEMKEMGLTELVGIYQTRHDRYMAS